VSPRSLCFRLVSPSTRKKSPPVEVVHLPGINHLLTPAKTGEVSEYAMLADKNITPEVAKTIATWLKK